MNTIFMDFSLFPLPLNPFFLPPQINYPLFIRLHTFGLTGRISLLNFILRIGGVIVSRGRRESKIADYYGIYGGRDIDVGFNVHNTASVIVGMPMLVLPKTYEVPKKIEAGLPEGEWKAYPGIVVKKAPGGFETMIFARGSPVQQRKWIPIPIKSTKLDIQFIRNAKKVGLMVRKYRRARP